MKKYSLKLFTVTLLFTVITAVSCSSTNNLGTKKLLKQDPAIVSGQLDNGMNYYILENGQPSNRISLRLVVKAGSCMEEDDQKGVAHFIEHLCFNGTENFKKNSLIDYAESIGMEFGPEVNAYTSFEETVYMLEIPADNPEYLEKALLIFHDWASAVSFEQEEIDKERGVIVEEWRGNLGLNGRLSDSLISFEYEDSIFKDRLPIGDMDIIKSIPRERIIDFYEKWYRPELMSVVVVGTLDPKAVETQIAETMKDIPASENPVFVTPNRVPNRTEKDVMLLQDAEMPYTTINIICQDETYTPRLTEDDFYLRCLDDAFFTILNQRLSEITMKPEAPWLMAQVGNASDVNFEMFNALSYVIKEGQFEQALKTWIDEFERYVLYGVTDSELQRVKDMFLDNADQTYAMAGSVTNAERASEICTQVLTGKVSLSSKQYYELEKRCISRITKEDLNNYMQKLFPNRGTMLTVMSPLGTQIPSKEEIIDLWENYTSEIELQAYQDAQIGDKLIPRPISKGKVVSEKDIPAFAAKEYVYENGCRVIAIPSKLQKGQVIFSAISKGGISLLSDKDYPSAYVSPMYAIYSGIAGLPITDLQKFLTTKNIGLNLMLNLYQEDIYANAPVQYLEEMLQVVNQFMVNPQFTDEGWNMVYLSMEQNAKNYCLLPNDAFSVTINKTLYGDSIKFAGVDQNFVNLLDRQKSEKLYAERFNNPSDFTYVLIGDFDAETVKDLCAYYIGTMETVESKEDANYLTSTIPAGITQKVVSKGQDQQSAVFIGFCGNLPAAKDINETWKDVEMIAQLRSLLDIRLREIIREDKSGTYGVSVSANIVGSAERYYEFEIVFGCEPGREQELTDSVIEAIKELQSTPVSKENVTKLTETYRRTLEVNRSNNYYWEDLVNAVEVLGYMPEAAVLDDISVIRWTTSTYLQELAQKYFNLENYVTVFLEPEQKQ